MAIQKPNTLSRREAKQLQVAAKFNANITEVKRSGHPGNIIDVIITTNSAYKYLDYLRQKGITGISLRKLERPKGNDGRGYQQISIYISDNLDKIRNCGVKKIEDSVKSGATVTIPSERGLQQNFASCIFEAQCHNIDDYLFLRVATTRSDAEKYIEWLKKKIFDGNTLHLESIQTGRQYGIIIQEFWRQREVARYCGISHIAESVLELTGTGRSSSASNLRSPVKRNKEYTAEYIPFKNCFLVKGDAETIDEIYKGINKQKIGNNFIGYPAKGEIYINEDVYIQYPNFLGSDELYNKLCDAYAAREEKEKKITGYIKTHALLLKNNNLIIHGKTIDKEMLFLESLFGITPIYTLSTTAEDEGATHGDAYMEVSVEMLGKIFSQVKLNEIYNSLLEKALPDQKLEEDIIGGEEFVAPVPDYEVKYKAEKQNLVITGYKETLDVLRQRFSTTFPAPHVRRVTDNKIEISEAAHLFCGSEQAYGSKELYDQLEETYQDNEPYWTQRVKKQKVLSASLFQN